jgi:hypothetical protein
MTTLQERRATAPTTDEQPDGQPAHPAHLMGRHPELYGIHGFADVLADSVPWAI